MCNRLGSNTIAMGGYFLKVIKCLLDHFFLGKFENVANKLKEHSMTKPIPRIGGNITSETGAKPS